jgi:hypothetical protein
MRLPFVCFCDRFLSSAIVWSHMQRKIYVFSLLLSLWINIGYTVGVYFLLQEESEFNHLLIAGLPVLWMESGLFLVSFFGHPYRSSYCWSWVCHLFLVLYCCFSQIFIGVMLFASQSRNLGVYGSCLFGLATHFFSITAHTVCVGAQLWWNGVKASHSLQSQNTQAVETTQNQMTPQEHATYKKHLTQREIPDAVQNIVLSYVATHIIVSIRVSCHDTNLSYQIRTCSFAPIQETTTTSQASLNQILVDTDNVAIDMEPRRYALLCTAGCLRCCDSCY